MLCLKLLELLLQKKRLVERCRQRSNSYQNNCHATFITTNLRRHAILITIHNTNLTIRSVSATTLQRSYCDRRHSAVKVILGEKIAGSFRKLDLKKCFYFTKHCNLCFSSISIRMFSTIRWTLIGILKFSYELHRSSFVFFCLGTLNVPKPNTQKWSLIILATRISLFKVSLFHWLLSFDIIILSKKEYLMKTSQQNLKRKTEMDVFHLRGYENFSGVSQQDDNVEVRKSCE